MIWNNGLNDKYNDMKILSDLFLFLKRPNTIKLENLSFADKIIKLGVLLLFYFVVNSILIHLTTYIITVLEVFIPGIIRLNRPLVEIVSPTQITTLVLFLDFLTRVALGPILEEFTFRYFLSNFNLVRFKISLSLIIGFVLYFCLITSELGGFIVKNGYSIYVLFFYVFIFITSILSFSCLSLFNHTLKKLDDWWVHHFSSIFYMVAIVFSLSHLVNAKIISLLGLFITGLILGYARIRLGFRYSIVLHILINTILLWRLSLN